MSTRSALAYIPKRKTIKQWTGIYCHFDGYPSTKGKEIWEVLHRDFINGKDDIGGLSKIEPEQAIQAFIDIYIKGHPSGWSLFPEKCYCHDRSFVMRDGLRDMTIDYKHPDPLYIEYVYVLDPRKHTMTILEMKDKPDFKAGEIRKKTFVDDEGYTDYGNCAYKHVELITINLLGDEPNWDKIEKHED